MKIRTDDNVIVISGKDKGRIGKVIRTEPKRDRVYVEGCQHGQAPPAPDPAGPTPRSGVIEKEGPVHVSNVAIVDPRTTSRRASAIRRDENGTRMRVTKRSARSWTDMARLKDRYNDEIRPRSCASSATPRRCRPRSCRRSRSTWASARPSRTPRCSRPPRRSWRHRRPAAEHPPRRKSVAAFKLREGMPVGLTVTLRDERAVRVPSIGLYASRIPPITDLPRPEPAPRSTGVATTRWASGADHLSRIDYDAIDQVRGLTSPSRPPLQPTPRRFALLERWACPSQAKAGPEASIRWRRARRGVTERARES
jgi:large subunit ribosomal protein L24